MNNFLNETCKMCGTKYHACSNCDLAQYFYLTDYCSWGCMAKDLEIDITGLTTEEIIEEIYIMEHII